MSRAWALQVLYRWEMAGAGTTLDDALIHTLATRKVSPRRMGHLRAVIQTLAAELPRVDEALSAALDNWRLDRVSVVDRSVLRIAGAELLFMRHDVPGPVAIQEGVRLAERYGGTASPRFVNGVLDAVLRQNAES
ncbi:MAG: transcription antitermination factor NusB [Gemmatimonadota bacterium]